MQKHWFKVTSTEQEGQMLLLTTVRDFVGVGVAIFRFVLLIDASVPKVSSEVGQRYCKGHEQTHQGIEEGMYGLNEEDFGHLY